MDNVQKRNIFTNVTSSSKTFRSYLSIIYKSIYLSIYLSIYFSIYISINLSIIYQMIVSRKCKLHHGNICNRKICDTLRVVALSKSLDHGPLIAWIFFMGPLEHYTNYLKNSKWKQGEYSVNSCIAQSWKMKIYLMDFDSTAFGFNGRFAYSFTVIFSNQASCVNVTDL
jgi:hypothetical protein